MTTTPIITQVETTPVSTSTSSVKFDANNSVVNMDDIFGTDLSTLDLPTDLHNFDPAIFESLLSTKSGSSQMDVEENVGAWLGSVYENNQTQSSSQSVGKLNHEMNGNNNSANGLIRDPLMSFNSLNL